MALKASKPQSLKVGDHNRFKALDIAIFRLNQPRGQCSKNNLKCIPRWKGRDGVTITISYQHTRVVHKTSYV